MADRQYRLDLQDTLFPMLSELQGRTVIVSSREEVSSASNKPAIAYCHNVMPTQHGLDSVGYAERVRTFASYEADFIDIRVIFGDEGTRLQLAFNAVGTAYILYDGDDTWTAVGKLGTSVPTTSFDVNKISVGEANGVSYIYYRSLAGFTFNETTSVFDQESFTGLDTSEVLGLVSSYSYLIAYTADAIAWSSLLTPTDFTPSQVTGAGGGNVAGIGGDILFVTSNAQGILVYTDTNIVSGSYTGNARYPFKFQEVEDSKGGIRLEDVAYEANSAAQYIYSKAGLQAVTSRKATTVLPETTDFLAGKKLEDYDESTGAFTVYELTATMQKKLRLIAARYLVISYGITEFTHALVYDTVLEKLGKLKLNHVDCFEFTGSQTEVSKESIAFLLADGSVQTLEVSTTSESLGVVMLGKLQYSRSRLITLQGAEIENIDTDAELAVYNRAAIDGKNPVTSTGYLAYSASKIRNYSFRATAINHSLLFIGKFNLVSVLVHYSIHGRR